MNDYGLKKVPFLFIIDYRKSKGHVFPAYDIPDDIQYKIGINNNIKNPSLAGNPHIKSMSPISFSDYRTSFNIVKKHLLRGDSYLVNLTKPTLLNTDVSLQDIFSNCVSKYLLNFRNEFIVFSPEPFIRINGDMVMTYPMKGTIRAELPQAASIILNNAKEAAEHATIVDLLRNDLSQFSDKVVVKRYRYIENIQTKDYELLQVSSEITGLVKKNFTGRIGDILDFCLPAGSVTGAPKQKTIDIIALAEGYNRNYYTGVFGWYDGQNLDSAVMIRFIEKTPEGLVYKSGGGITAHSICEEEYEELLNKIYVPVA